MLPRAASILSFSSSTAELSLHSPANYERTGCVAKGKTTRERMRKGGGGGVTRWGESERRGAKIGKVDEKRVKAVRVC
jgi:hypothetical protein